MKTSCRTIQNTKQFVLSIISTVIIFYNLCAPTAPGERCALSASRYLARVPPVCAVCCPPMYAWDACVCNVLCKCTTPPPCVVCAYAAYVYCVQRIFTAPLLVRSALCSANMWCVRFIYHAHPHIPCFLSCFPPYTIFPLIYHVSPHVSSHIPMLPPIYHFSSHIPYFFSYFLPHTIFPLKYHVSSHVSSHISYLLPHTMFPLIYHNSSHIPCFFPYAVRPLMGHLFPLHITGPLCAGLCYAGMMLVILRSCLMIFSLYEW